MLMLGLGVCGMVVVEVVALLQAMWFLERQVVRYDRFGEVEKLFAFIEIGNEALWSLVEVPVIQVHLLLEWTLVVEGALGLVIF